jgi:ppGpp synthetase/RelA/SpoT-type nucleotidyltranferase
MMSGISEVFRVAREDFRKFETFVRAVEGILAAQTKALLYSFVERIDRIESRTKEFVSIRDNYVDAYGIPASVIDLDDFLRDANDLIGIRVVAFYNEDVDSIRDLLMKVYTSASLEEKLTVHDVKKGSRFGYRAVHVNFEFSDEVIFRSQPRSRVGVEIQIRTILSDAWARHSHKLVYKGQNVSSDQVLRAFAQSAAMLEGIDERIEQIRSLLSDIPAERNEVSKELSWMRLYDGINQLMGTPIREDDVKSMFVSLYDQVEPREDGDSGDEFVEAARKAWASFGDVDFVRYGIKDPLTQLKVALYGLNREKYKGLVPLHMRRKINDILQVGSRRN